MNVGEKYRLIRPGDIYDQHIYQVTRVTSKDFGFGTDLNDGRTQCYMTIGNDPSLWELIVPFKNKNRFELIGE